VRFTKQLFRHKPDEGVFGDCFRTAIACILELDAIPTEDVAHALFCAKTFSDGLPYIFSGTSRTGVNHAVIGQGDQIIHDPSLTDAGIIGPCDDGMFCIEWIVISAEGRGVAA
jgi:hypothetical protein